MHKLTLPYRIHPEVHLDTIRMRDVLCVESVGTELDRGRCWELPPIESMRYPLPRRAGRCAGRARSAGAGHWATGCGTR